MCKPRGSVEIPEEARLPGMQVPGWLPHMVVCCAKRPAGPYRLTQRELSFTLHGACTCVKVHWLTERHTSPAMGVKRTGCAQHHA